MSAFVSIKPGVREGGRTILCSIVLTHGAVKSMAHFKIHGTWRYEQRDMTRQEISRLSGLSEQFLEGVETASRAFMLQVWSGEL